MDQARRDLLVQAPRHGDRRGTFALRSPVRPNPIAMSVVRLVRIEGTTLTVVGLDCLDGTPLIDIKPYFASSNSVPDAVVAGIKKAVVSHQLAAGAKHLPLGRRQDNKLRRVLVDHRQPKAAQLVVHPEITPGMQREIILPEAARERVADHHDGRPGASGLDQIAAALELRRQRGRRAAAPARSR